VSRYEFQMSKSKGQKKFKNNNFELCHLTSQLRKNYKKREVGVLEKLYSGTFKRLATLFSSKIQRPPQVTSYVTHKQ